MGMERPAVSEIAPLRQGIAPKLAPPKERGRPAPVEKTNAAQPPILQDGRGGAAWVWTRGPGRPPSLGSPWPL